MISFSAQNEFHLSNEVKVKDWLEKVIASEAYSFTEIDFIFCSDDFLLGINQEFLNHDTYTDILTFDHSFGKTIQAEIYISTDRVQENAKDFDVDFEQELLRVLVHGVLHCCGYNDATDDEKQLMREKENEKINMFHVEQK
ncbi:MAG: rRNA maturation RNase YbeY [Bacteroidota bacterium]